MHYWVDGGKVDWRKKKFHSMKVTNWSLRCGFLLVFGLCLYLLDIGLHLGLAAKYLTMQGCYRSVSHTFSNFKLNDLVDLENLTENLNSKGNCFPIFLSQPRLCPDYYYYLSYYSSRVLGCNQIIEKKKWYQLPGGSLYSLTPGGAPWSKHFF